MKKLIICFLVFFGTIIVKAEKLTAKELLERQNARAAKLAASEKARAESDNKIFKQARERRLRSLELLQPKKPSPALSVRQITSLSKSESEEEEEIDNYIHSASTELEQSYRENEIGIRQAVMDRKWAKTQAEKNSLRKEIYRAADLGREIRNQAREKGEDWAR